MSSRRPPEPPRQGQLDFGLTRRAEPREAPEEPRGEVPPPRRRDEPQAQPRVFAVTELVRSAARTLEARFGLVWVEGEVSNVSMPRSGHLFFCLKDEESQLPAVMFARAAQRVPFRLTDGMKVRAAGRLSIFEGQGKFQLYVDLLEPSGVGAQQVALAQLKARLAAEGLFDPARKRPLPAWPRRIGLVTSPTGAAVRDIVRVAERRGKVRLLLSPCQVQGDAAPASIVVALERIARQPDIDVVILGRGGGSSEDLGAFNDERVVRAVARCPVPVVSAVGHEVDFTLTDFAADHRAPTPSAAAELVVPLFSDAVERVAELEARLRRAGARLLAEARQRLQNGEERAQAALHQLVARRRRLLDAETRRLTALHPRARLTADRAALAGLTARLGQVLGPRLHRHRAELEGLRGRLAARMVQALEGRRRAFAAAAGKLDALSPLGVLARGYALARTPAGHVVTRADELTAGDPLEITLSDGRVDCRVESIHPGSDETPGKPTR